MTRRTLLIGLGLAASACSASPRSPVALDCTQGDGYEFHVVESYEASSLTATPQWYSWGDPTPDASHSLQVGTGIPTESIPEGRCGSQGALVLRSQGHTDYGSGFGQYRCDDGCAANTFPNDASGWEGVSFWARSPGETNKGFTFGLNDRTSSSDVANTVKEADGGAVTYEDGGTEHYCFIPPTSSRAGVSCTVDPNTHQTSNCGTAGAEFPHDACGNAFQTVITTTDEWKLYRLPWSSLHQSADNRRQASGIDPSSTWDVTISLPKESRTELWLDDVGFYRRAMGDSGAN
jgi:hypothetical protein